MEWSDIDRPVARPVWWSALGATSLLSLALVLNSFSDLRSLIAESAMQQEALQASLLEAEKLKQVASASKSVSQKTSQLEDSDRIIVKYKERDLPPGLTIAAERANMEKAQGLKRLFTIEGINADVYTISEEDTAPEAVQRILAKHKNVVEYAEVDQIVYPSIEVNDPSFASQWHLPKVQAPVAWDTAQGSGITVATIDSGADMDHPDLAASLVVGTNVVDGSKNVDDVYGHGTAVAGMMTALLNNTNGGVGIAPQAKNMVIKVGDGSSYMSYLARGITYAADNGAKVANLSWSGACNNATVQNAAQYMRGKGGVVVISSGNTGSDLGGSNAANVICAGATNSGDTNTWFSSFGVYVDLVAPGEGVYLTTNGGGYGSWSGTSFSSPLVAASYALVLSANPALSPSEADNILFTTADDLGAAGWDPYYGHGRVNVAKAVALAKSSAGAQDTTAPAAPTGLKAVSVGSANAALAWNTATDNIGVVGYRIFRNGSLLTTVSGSTFGDTGLTAQTAYTYTVKAVDKAGNVSADSNQLAITTSAPEFNIVSFSVPTKTNTTATVEAALSANGGVTVKYGTSAGSLGQSAQSSTTAAMAHSVGLSGLSANTTYYYQVVATDAAGKVVNSAVSSFKTPKGGGGGGGGKPTR